MKNANLSKQKTEYLFDHVLDGFKGSHEGIEQLRAKHIISDEEYTELLVKNSKRLIERIREFKIMFLEAAKRATCIIFAMMFGYMQVNGDDLDMRKPSRASRSARHARARRGRRNDEGELFEINETAA